MKKVVAIAIALVMVLAMATVASAAYPRYTWGTYMQLQQQGSVNNQVLGIQRVLAQTNYGISTDGNFGPLTANAVRTFQARNGLVQDAMVGTATWNKLQSNLVFDRNQANYDYYMVGYEANSI